MHLNPAALLRDPLSIDGVQYGLLVQMFGFRAPQVTFPVNYANDMLLNPAGEVVVANTSPYGNGVKFSVNGSAKVTQLYANGWSDPPVYNAGSYIGWNKATGNAEFDLISAGPGTSARGWFFYDYNTTSTTLTLVALITNKGMYRGTGFGSPLVNNGTVGAAANLDFTNGCNQNFTLTSATACTVSASTNPSYPCAVRIRISAPASGTSPAISYSSAFKGSWPTSVTLAKTSLLEGFWDGSFYYYLAGCLNV